VTVGRTANVLGNIESEVANIHGTVNGEIRTRSVIISSTARVTGDVILEELTIDAGAYIEGQMMRRDAEQSRLNLVVGDNV
jgi:cytoskeletal protein CcmA (bactofilin family)